MKNNWGNQAMASLEPGPSVMKLTKEPLTAVPLKYILPDQEPIALPDGGPLPKVPTIDMKKLILGEAQDLELEKLHSTCKEWGLFQLVNHGVCFPLLEKLKHEIEGFFNLPSEEKMKYSVRPGDFEGYGTVVRHSNQKLDWGDRFYMLINPIHKRKPYLFPELPSSLRNTLESYFSELQNLAMTLTTLMGKALGMDTKEMEIFEDGMQAVRITNYPPCPQPELVLGLSPHSDGSGITILHEVKGEGGLQIKRNGVWMPVNFLPDAFVVNVGDIMEILSNGAYASIEHRVAVNSEKERISIAMFFNPKLEATVGPATSLLNPENPPFFKSIRMEEYVKDFFSRNLNGKSNLERMRIGSEEGSTTA